MYSLWFKNSVKDDFLDIQTADLRFVKNSLQEFVSHYSESYENELIKTKLIKKFEDSELYRLKLRRYKMIYEKNGNKITVCSFTDNIQ